MTHPHPPIIIFDLDGCLLTSKGHLLAAFEIKSYPWVKWNESVIHSLQPLEIVRMFEKSARSRSISSLRAMLREFGEYIPNRIRRVAFFLKYKRLMEKYDWKYNDFFPGAVEMIQDLSGKGIIFGAASNSFGHRVEDWLKYKDLKNIIQCMTSRDDRKTLGVKPNPRVLLGLLLRMKKHYGWSKIEKNRVAFVGDNISDILTAKYAKVKSIGVLSGHATKSELKLAYPDFLLNYATDIPKVLHKLFPDFKTH
jgi:phosphoglycolate phosphatase-like HAD superfamily hydrolase